MSPVLEGFSVDSAGLCKVTNSDPQTHAWALNPEVDGIACDLVIGNPRRSRRHSHKNTRKAPSQSEKKFLLGGIAESP